MNAPELQTGFGDVAEVEEEAAREGLEAEDAEQFSRTGTGVLNGAILDIGAHISPDVGEGEGGGAAGPVQLRAGLSFAVADYAGKTELAQHHPQIGAFQLKLHVGAPARQPVTVSGKLKGFAA